MLGVCKGHINVFLQLKKICILSVSGDPQWFPSKTQSRIVASRHRNKIIQSLDVKQLKESIPPRSHDCKQPSQKSWCSAVLEGVGGRSLTSWVEEICQEEVPLRLPPAPTPKVLAQSRLPSSIEGSTCWGLQSQATEGFKSARSHPGGEGEHSALCPDNSLAPHGATDRQDAELRNLHCRLAECWRCLV